MLTYKLVRDQRVDDLLMMIYTQGSMYLQPKLDLVQLTWGEFGKYFREVGQIYRIYDDEELAGMCWVDQKGDTLHLLGIVVKETCRGKGIGSQTLRMLEETYQGNVKQIELKVHRSNPEAKALYERLGYETVRYDRDSCFYVMSKQLVPEAVMVA